MAGPEQTSKKFRPSRSFHWFRAGGDRGSISLHVKILKAVSQIGHRRLLRQRFKRTLAPRQLPCLLGVILRSVCLRRNGPNPISQPVQFSGAFPQRTLHIRRNR